MARSKSCVVALPRPQPFEPTVPKQLLTRSSCGAITEREMASAECKNSHLTPPKAQKHGENAMQGQYEEIHNDMSRLAEELMSLIAPLRKKVEVLESAMMCVENRLLDLETNMKLTPFNCISDDGDFDFVWRVRSITSILQKQKQLKDGEELKLCSPSFYTSRFGYKLCLWLKFNSFSPNENYFISLYFCIMKGEYDTTLTWPFNYAVMLILLDQDEKSNISHRLTMDPSCPNFRQPSTERNGLVGVDKFASLSMLASDSSYAKNDVVYFKVCIRKADHPST